MGGAGNAGKGGLKVQGGRGAAGERLASLSLSLCLSLYIYIHIYIYKEREREKEGSRREAIYIYENIHV
jgi:hypothetical protein